MRVLLFGIYALGARALARLAERRIDVVGVVTKPDRGTGQTDLLSQVDRMGLPLFQPQTLEDPALEGDLQALRPDLLAVAGYHLRLPTPLLQIPPLGAINTHLSLLPRGRGPCPWKWAIIRGERTTGVTIHVMTPRFDRGGILAQREVALGDDETGESLFQRLASEGAGLLGETLEGLRAGTRNPRDQNEASATYDGPPSDDDARVRWTAGAREIRNLIRGLHPRPGAWTTHHGKRYGIAGASIVETSGNLSPAGLIVDSGDGIVTASTGRGFIRMEGLTARESGSPAPTEEFPVGTVFGED